MDRCIPGREVVLRFRNRRTGKPWTASVVCPATWTRHKLLTYARGCHPNDTVRVEEWKGRGRTDDPWETRLWIVSPKEMLGG